MLVADAVSERVSGYGVGLPGLAALAPRPPDDGQVHLGREGERVALPERAPVGGHRVRGEHVGLLDRTDAAQRVGVAHGRRERVLVVGPERCDAVVVVHPERLPRLGQQAEPALGERGGAAGEQQRPVGGAEHPRPVGAVPA